MELSCPKCRGPMWSYERKGVVVDHCIECRGIFLDRGELEALLAAEADYYQDAAPATVIAPLEDVAGGVPYRPPLPPPPLRLVPPPAADPVHPLRTRHAHERRERSFLRQVFD